MNAADVAWWLTNWPVLLGAIFLLGAVACLLAFTLVVWWLTR